MMPRFNQWHAAAFGIVLVGALAAVGILVIAQPDRRDQQRAPPVHHTTRPAPPQDPAQEARIASRGLGIPRAHLQRAWEADGFTFELGHPVDGEPRLIGKVPEGRGLVELIGPPENVFVVTLLVGDLDETAAETRRRCTDYFNRVAPDWPFVHTWFAGFRSSDEATASIAHAGKLFSAEKQPSIYMLSLSVRRDVLTAVVRDQ